MEIDKGVLLLAWPCRILRFFATVTDSPDCGPRNAFSGCGAGLDRLTQNLSSLHTLDPFNVELSASQLRNPARLKEGGGGETVFVCTHKQIQLGRHFTTSCDVLFFTTVFVVVVVVVVVVVL